MKQLRISAKNLGYLTLPNFCPRCFWIKMHMRFKLPYQIFPGIFSSIDSYSKKITNYYYEKHGNLSEWFKDFNISEPIKVPSLRDFYIIDQETNIKLTGIPDEMFLRTDESYFIADYKTARFTSHQDELIPMYEVQLNGYAYIAERVGYKPMTGLGLIYYEPFTDITPDLIDDYAENDGFYMYFYAHTMGIKFDPDMIPVLLQKARQLYDKLSPPDPVVDFKDCRTVEELKNVLQ